LRPGDLLVAFTDGVTDALNPAGEEFGEARLKDVLRAALGASAGEMSEKLAGEVRDWIGDAEQHDDVTIVVVEVAPEGGRSSVAAQGDDGIDPGRSTRRRRSRQQCDAYQRQRRRRDSRRIRWRDVEEEAADEA